MTQEELDKLLTVLAVSGYYAYNRAMQGNDVALMQFSLFNHMFVAALKDTVANGLEFPKDINQFIKNVEDTLKKHAKKAKK